MTSSASPRLPLRSRHHLTSVPASDTRPISSPAYYRTLPPLQLPPSKDLDRHLIEQRSTQSRSPSATATANSEASVTPEPSKRPLSPSPTPSSSTTRLPSVFERPRSPPAGTSPATTIPPPVTTTTTTAPATATTITTATTIGLKRPRSPSLISTATTQPFFATAQEPPRKMSRFNGPTADAWQGQHPHHPAMQDRVVLPPLATAVDNGLTPSRRTSMVSSPTSYTTSAQGGSYTFTNAFESQRPQPGSGSMSSPSMNGVNGEHGTHPYRRPSMAGRSQSAMISSRTPASPMSQDLHQAPRLTTAYSDPNTATTASMSWNIPPPQNNERPATAAYSAYGDYGATNAFDASTGLAGDGTPQSPSFAFTSNGFAAAAAAQPGMYGLSNTTARAAAHHHAHHPSFGMAAQMSSSQSTTAPSSNTSSTLIGSEQSQNHASTPIEEELAQLRTKVRELEFVNDLVQLRVVELENEKAKLLGHSTGSGSDKASSTAGSPSARSTASTLAMPNDTDPDFQTSWQKRTDARVKRFCSLNRAGNALCAWHDSRRERRAYPPRMAPPGTLNCGCTFEEALFEESLSRHKVGSYLPGEMVRMDPALRNPLLALLQWRYGYKDGDFERDPSNGRWVDGEGEHVWQQKASSGGSNSRRKQSDAESA